MSFLDYCTKYQPDNFYSYVYNNTQNNSFILILNSSYYNFSLHGDYNGTQNNSLKNSSKLLEYDLTTSHLKNIVQNNVTTSSNLDLLPQIVPDNNYNDSQLYSQKNSLKNTIQKNVTTSLKLNSLFQVIPQKSSIGVLCNNPECFNEVKILRFGKGRKKEYCSKQCFTRKNNCTRKKSCCTHFNEALLNDRKEFVKLINEGASKFNIYFILFFFLGKK
jgi:hypothetical protein